MTINHTTPDDSTPPDILAPISAEAFFHEYWEKNPLHIERSDTSFFSHLVSAAEMQSLLNTRAVSFPDVQVVRAEQPIPASHYCDATHRISVPRLLEQHHQGATLVWSQAQRQFPALAALCRTVTRAWGIPCQTNLYLSPAGAQGLGSHYDTHDVFVLQISGSKVFSIYPSNLELPLTDDQYDPALNPGGEALTQVHLTAGDTLYVPRGVVHDAVAGNDGPSLHITLGVFPVLLRDVLQRALHLAAESDVRLRRSISPLQSGAAANYGSAPRTKIEAPLLDSLPEFFKADQLDQALMRMIDEIALECQPEMQSLERITPPASAKQHGVILWQNILGWTHNGEKLTLRVAGQILEFNEPTASIVQQMLQSGAVAALSQASLDIEQATALTDMLASAGVISFD